MEKKHSGSYVYYRWLVLLLASGLCLLPLWATVMGGFKTSGELRTNAFGLPRQWLFDNYVSIALSGRFWQMLGNSAFIAFVTVVLTLLVSSMAAFVLCGQEVARQLPGFGAYLPVCDSCPAGLYSGARHGALGFVLGSYFAADSFQPGLRDCVAAGLFRGIAP